MKVLLTLLAVSFSFSAFAKCPDMEGRYPKCKSEIRDIRGEYIVEQYMKDDVTFYQIHYNDDETNESRTDAIRTDGKLESRKERIPRIGIKVRLDSRSRCDGDSVISDAEAFVLGKKVGTFQAKIWREGGTLYSNLDGRYLSKEVHKRIVCTQE